MFYPGQYGKLVFKGYSLLTLLQVVLSNTRCKFFLRYNFAYLNLLSIVIYSYKSTKLTINNC